MSKQALGLIETIGLATGVVAADAALKAANVHLIGYEISDNFGGIVVKLEGDVGAIQAAISAAKAAAQTGRGYFSSVVIPRPVEKLRQFIENGSTVISGEPDIEAEKRSISAAELSSVTKERPLIQDRKEHKNEPMVQSVPVASPAAETKPKAEKDKPAAAPASAAPAAETKPKAEKDKPAAAPAPAAPAAETKPKAEKDKPVKTPAPAAPAAETKSKAPAKVVSAAAAKPKTDKNPSTNHNKKKQ